MPVNRYLSTNTARTGRDPADPRRTRRTARRVQSPDTSTKSPGRNVLAAIARTTVTKLPVASLRTTKRLAAVVDALHLAAQSAAECAGSCCCSSSRVAVVVVVVAERVVVAAEADAQADAEPVVMVVRVGTKNG